jgi:hypothetical protein
MEVPHVHVERIERIDAASDWSWSLTLWTGGILLQYLNESTQMGKSEL